MKAEIISIGDEILIGQIINTNAAWIGEQINMAGFDIVRMTTIGDHEREIHNALNEAKDRADLILLTGGLGPTKDDKTKDSLCSYFHVPLVFNDEAYEDIDELFRKRGWKLNDINKKQAELPKNALALKNKNGTAPGIWIEESGKIYVSMPGVPFEMKPMIIGEVIPKLKDKFDARVIYHKTVLTQGMGESWIAEKISDWEDNLPENIKLAYLPQPGMVRLRLSSVGDNREQLEKQVDTEIEKLKEIIGELIFGYNNESLEEVTGKLLRKNKATLSTAESCTGGYIAHLITGIAGSSDYFKGAVVSYANEIKENELGVKEEDLEKFGAVSEVVVRQMAEGVKKKMKTGYAIATSGIAGPSGGTEEKPVGTTWIAIATPDRTIAKKFLFGEHRGRNIRRTALQALSMLRRELLAIGC